MLRFWVEYRWNGSRRRRECEQYLGLQGKEGEVEAVALRRLEMSCGMEKWAKPT